MGVEMRRSEIIVGVLAPLLVAPLFTSYLFGLLIELDRREKEIRELATYDELTNVLTRWAFMLKASAYMDIAIRYEKKFGILTVDLDNFKTINDTYGHWAGDHVLRAFGTIVNKETRKSDIIGRMGGDEFILLLTETDLEGTRDFANNLQYKIRKAKIALNDGRIIRYTISIGAALFTAGSQAPNIQELIKQSDEALYAAKTAGRNRTSFYRANDVR
jgi:diguanylate cyclase (GGDEF)-like protein